MITWQLINSSTIVHLVDLKGLPFQNNDHQCCQVIDLINVFNESTLCRILYPRYNFDDSNFISNIFMDPMLLTSGPHGSSHGAEFPYYNFIKDMID